MLLRTDRSLYEVGDTAELTIFSPRQQDRMYLLDAWLYAPGKEKYEYMIQLQTILGSFRCGAS